MTQAEKLEALLKKATKNGYHTPDDMIFLPNWGKSAPLNSLQFADDYKDVWHIPIEVVIFNKNFARALFPKGKYIFGQLIPNDWEVDPPILQTQGYFRWFTPADVNKSYCMVTTLIELDAADYHLQQAVIADDPIDYMYKEVFGGE